MASRRTSPRRPARIERFLSPAALGAVGAIGALGLIGLAVALFGPRRLQREVIQPMQTALTDRAEKLWTEARRPRA
jgi:hypothetical protein